MFSLTHSHNGKKTQSGNQVCYKRTVINLPWTSQDGNELSIISKMIIIILLVYFFGQRKLDTIITSFFYNHVEICAVIMQLLYRLGNFRPICIGVRLYQSIC